MSNDNDLGKRVERAVNWCKDARDILKIRHEEWYKRDEKSVDFGRLDKYLDKVKSGLSDLEKVKHKDKQKQLEQTQLYEKFAEEFVKRADLGRVAKENDNQELSKLLIDHLICLDLEIQTALGKKNTTGLNVDDLKKSLQGKETEQYNTALKKAELIQTALAKLNQEMHVFTGDVPKRIQTAKDYFKSGNLPLALQELGDVPGEETLQRGRHYTFGKYRVRLSRAEEFNEALQQFDRMRGTTVSEKVILLIGEAKHEADTNFAYGAASDKLDKVEELYKQTIGKLSKEDRKAFDELHGARKSFEEAYAEARDLINKNRSLRGMLVDGPAKKLLGEAEKTLDLARKAADETTNPATVKHAEQLLKVVEEKVKLAIEESKKAKEQSKENLEAMKKWLELLPTVERQLQNVSVLRGTEQQQKELTTLIENAKKELKPIDGFSSGESQLFKGYVKAVKVLSAYTNIVEQAKQSNKEALSKDFPKVVEEALDRVTLAFFALDPHIPRFFADIQLDELEAIKENIRVNLFKAKNDNPPSTGKAEQIAVDQCEQFQEFLEDEFHRQVDAKAGALSKLDEYYRERERLRESGMPIEMLAVAERLVNTASNVDLADREWRRALRNIETALQLTADVAQSFKKHESVWRDIEKKLELYKQAAHELSPWPPLMGPARALLDECVGLEQQFLRTLDLEACVKQFDDLKLERSYQQLMFDAQQMYVPDAEQIKLLSTRVKEATLKVRARIDEIANGPLAKLEKHLTSVGDPRTNSLRAALDKVALEWENYSYKPDTDPAKIEKRLDEALRKLDQIETLAKKIAGDSKMLNSLVEQMKSEENQRHAEELPRFVRDQIDRLEDPTSAEMYRRMLEGLEKLTLSGSNGALEGMERLRDQVLQDLSGQRKAAQSIFDGALKTAELLRESLFEIKGRHKDFQLYQEQLEKELLDAKTMLASGDPDLLEAAQQLLWDIERRVTEVDPQRRGKDAPRYAAARDRHTKISKMLGSTETRGGEIVIQNRMPNTYKRLCEVLDAQWAKCMKMGPKDAFEALHDIDKEVTEAYEKALQLNDEHKRYKVRRAKFEKDWEKVKKKTKTSVTEKTKNFQAYVESRLNDAEGQRHTENGIDEAYKTLASLEDKIRELLDIPDANDMREKLQQMDAECFKEQELIRDMARQFRVELENFKEVVLKEAKKKIEAKFEEKLILRVDMEDSLTILENLKNQASSAGKVVKPYLANLETGPYKRSGADEAPLLEKARADFKTARDLLEKGKVAAERLANATTTTNVNLTIDLTKVQDHWVGQVKQYTTTLREFAAAVAKEAKNMTPQESELKEQEIVDLRKHSDEAGKLVELAAVRFNVSAFQKPFSMIYDVKVDAEEKRAVREEALRTMREYRDDLLNNPVLRKLTDKSNPLHRPKLLAATGYLRAALKRIEVETLIGI